jgi:hypothetical protein
MQVRIANIFMLVLVLVRLLVLEPLSFSSTSTITRGAA